MKKTLIFFGIFFVFYSCSVKKIPVFLKLDDVKIINIASDTIRLGVNAYFNNPNDVGGKIFTDDIKVLVNEVEVAQVTSDVFKIPARKDFTIPLKVAIPTKRVFENNKNGILGGLLNSILNKSVKVQFKGTLQYVFLGFKKEFIVDKIEEIYIKL
jgi:hypothetical protein